MNETEIKSNQIRSLLATAEYHFNRSEWEQALGCLIACWSSIPNTRRRLMAGARYKTRLTTRPEIRARLAEGKVEAAVSRGQPGARNRAQGIGATHNVLDLHAESAHCRDHAQEALAWRATVDDSLARARRHEQSGQIDKAIATLRELLPKLTANDQEELGQAARDMLNTLLLQQREVDEQVHEAQQAFEEFDFERACQLADDLSQRFPDRIDVKRIQSNFCSRWRILHGQLQSVQASLDGGRLDDAVAMLGKVREQMPRNPNWQALWLAPFPVTATR